MSVRVGVLGAARISQKALFVPAADTAGVEVVAIASRDRARAQAQAEAHGIARVHASYEALLADETLDAIYNPLPISLHMDYTLAALAAGKHVLCEKPFASNAEQAARMVAAGEAAGRLCVEAFHWRYHPLAARIAAEVERLGELREVDAGFTVEIPPDNAIRHSYALSGGALMDIGCYAVQWVRFVHPEEPQVVAARMREGEPRVDVRAEVELEYRGGARARITADMSPGVDRRTWLRVVGSRGELSVENPVAPHLGHELTVTVDGATERAEVAGRTTFHHQLEAFVEAVNTGAPLPTGGTDAIATLTLIDAAYEAAGLPQRGEP